MKNVLHFSLCLLLCALSFQTFAQSWEIKLHSTDLDTLKEEVTDYMENGYVPMGITYDNVELYILYIEDSSVKATAWSIEWYESPTELKKAITSNMNKGYVPSGITYTGDLFYVLYIKMKSSVDKWLLTPSAQDLQSVHDAIQPDIDNGYVPMGIATYEDEYWTLLLHIPGTTIKRWMIETYEVGKHGDNIDAAIKKGYLPWGIDYRADSEEIDVLYAGF